MNRLITITLMALLAIGQVRAASNTQQFVKVDGPNLVQPNGEKLYIQGTNLGNWLNPEGYMFSFGRTNSPRMINELFCEMMGPVDGDERRRASCGKGKRRNQEDLVTRFHKD